jgi:hypothetical protein
MKWRDHQYSCSQNCSVHSRIAFACTNQFNETSELIEKGAQCIYTSTLLTCGSLGAKIRPKGGLPFFVFELRQLGLALNSRLLGSDTM